MSDPIVAVSFWDTVVINAAPIIVAITGFGAMIGGFVIQYCMMKQQNLKIEQNAIEAYEARRAINKKLDTVVVSTNGIVEKNVALARAAGLAEGAQIERSRADAANV